jgi:hypothetical protein
MAEKEKQEKQENPVQKDRGGANFEGEDLEIIILYIASNSFIGRSALLNHSPKVGNVVIGFKMGLSPILNLQGCKI